MSGNCTTTPITVYYRISNVVLPEVLLYYWWSRPSSFQVLLRFRHIFPTCLLRMILVQSVGHVLTVFVQKPQDPAGIQDNYGFFGWLAVRVDDLSSEVSTFVKAPKLLFSVAEFQWYVSWNSIHAAQIQSYWTETTPSMLITS